MIDEHFGCHAAVWRVRRTVIAQHPNILPETPRPPRRIFELRFGLTVYAVTTKHIRRPPSGRGSLLIEDLGQLGDSDVSEAQVGGGIVSLDADSSLLQVAPFTG